MKNRKEIVKDYKGFVESNKSYLDKNLIKEGFLNKMWRSFTGADEKDIEELSDKIKNLYDSFNEVGKKEFKRLLSVFVRKENLPSWSSSGQKKDFNNVLDGKKWYGDTSDFVKPHLGRSIDKIKKNLKDIYTYLSSEEKKIEEEENKEKIEKEVDDINSKIDKYNQILDNYKELTKFNRDKLLQEFEYIFKSIPGCPWGESYFSNESFIPTECFINNFYKSDKDKEFTKTGKFNQLVEKLNNRERIIKETDINKLYEEIDTGVKKFYEDIKLKDQFQQLEYKSKLKIKPNAIPSYGFYQKVIDWAKEELAGKTIKEILRSILKEKIVVIENSDSKETKTEGDKLVAGNIVYSGQNFNNLNKDNISKFINKEGYRESYSGKAIYTTNNIPYAFYYCYLRFGLESQKVTDTLFPTIYKITLKPGTEFFYKGDTGIDEVESKSALICGVSGYHSGNRIVNNQSVEISIVDSNCIEKIEAIDHKDLISYLESPELKKDNDKWIPEDNFKTGGKEIEWYKGLSKK